jgi:hypothetical protein
VLLTVLENGAAIETANIGRESAFGLFGAMYSRYTHEFLSHILGAKRKSVTLAAQSMQSAGLISYRRGTIQVLDRAGLEKASCECYAIVKERFDAFLIPPQLRRRAITRTEPRARKPRMTDLLVYRMLLCNLSLSLRTTSNNGLCAELSLS